MDREAFLNELALLIDAQERDEQVVIDVNIGFGNQREIYIWNGEEFEQQECC